MASLKRFVGTLAQRLASSATGNAGDLFLDSDTGDVGMADGVTLLKQLPRLAWEAEVDGRRAAGVDPTGVTECSAALNAMFAANAGKVVRLVGIFNVSANTVIIRGHADCSGATFNYSGTGTAVRVGAGAVLARKRIRLPDVVYTAKPSTGWVAGTIGVQLLNCNTCVIDFNHITGFAVGLDVYGQAQGSTYLTVFAGHLNNNQVNLRFNADATGWANENVVIGGRYGHATAEGTRVPGTRHVYIPSVPSLTNNNRIVGASLESAAGTTEYVLECCGSDNLFDWCRWEDSAGPRIIWGPNATRNIINGGYNAISLLGGPGSITYDPAVGTANQVLTPRQSYRPTSAGEVWENSASGSSPTLTVMNAGQIAAGGNPNTAYSVRITAVSTNFKATADSFDKIQINGSTGYIWLGAGTATPAANIHATGSGAILLTGALGWNSDGVSDVGFASSLRPRSLYLTGGISTGIRTVTANATLTANDGTVLVNAAGTVTVALPNAATTPGKVFRLRGIGAGSVTVAVVASGGSVDGGTTTTIAAGGRATVQSDGINWWVV